MLKPLDSMSSMKIILMVLALMTVVFGANETNETIDDDNTRTKRQCICVGNRPCNCRNNGNSVVWCLRMCMNNNQCPMGVRCINGCCQNPAAFSTSNVCFGGPAYSMSMNNMCGSGMAVVNGYCCPCSSGQVLGIPCVNNLCPNMYTCNTNLNTCCPSPVATVANTVPVTTPSTSMVMSVGPCVNGMCPTGFVCLIDNRCYAQMIMSNNNQGQSAGPCIGGACPTGYMCIGGQCYVGGGGGGGNGINQPTPCVNGACPVGFTCQNGNCVATTPAG